MCQALCPGTETLAYAYPGGDAGLNRAASLSSNQPYTSLANAFKYRKSFDEICACKKADESWAVVLRKAESMLEQRKGDLIVTAEKAEEMSRPKVVQARKAADKKADEETKEAAEIAAAAPTASKESAGIGPQSIESNARGRPGRGLEAGSHGRRRPEENDPGDRAQPDPRSARAELRVFRAMSFPAEAQRRGRESKARRV